jgi:hypothetical protein
LLSSIALRPGRLLPGEVRLEMFLYLARKVKGPVLRKLAFYIAS